MFRCSFELNSRLLLVVAEDLNIDLPFLYCVRRRSYKNAKKRGYLNSMMSKFDPKKEGRKVAFVTLLTDDKYFDGVSVLLKTLFKNNKCEGIMRVCLVDESRVHKTTLKRLGALCDDVVCVPPLVHIAATKENSDTIESEKKPSWESSEMTKLHIWNLTEYEQVFYIDADCMIVGSIEHMFKETEDVDFAAAPDVFPPDRFNAGVMIIKPSAERFADLCQALHTLPSYDGGDTGFLNEYFGDWYSGCAASRLPYAYNCQRILYWFTHEKRPGYWDSIRDKKIIHFSSSPKPWEQTMTTVRGDLELQWWLALMER